MPKDRELYLSDDYRIRPLDGLQWIMERRTGTGGGRWKYRQRRLDNAGERWMAYAFCRTRAGLETAVSRLKAEEGIVLDPTPLATLPVNFPKHGSDWREDHDEHPTSSIPEVREPLYVQGDGDHAAVCGAATGIIVKDGLESIAEANAWRDGYLDAPRSK